MGESLDIAGRRRVRWAALSTLALLLSPLAGGHAAAATLYVRVAGDDARDGRSPASALRTITRAAAIAQPGDEVVVGPGTYVEGDIRPGAFGQVSFMSDRRGVSTGDPPGDVVLDATDWSTGFELNGKLGIRIDGFVVYGAAEGIYAKSGSHALVLSNNVVCNNRRNGIYIQDSRDAVIFNNLVYNNGRSGILVSGNTEGAAGVRIVNNTAYGNLNRGIFLAGTRIASPDARVLNNVVAENRFGGIQVNTVARTGYLSAGNVVGDRVASGTPVDVTDVLADPLFVAPAGSDGVLGGSGYADDDFRLSQLAAGQSKKSPAVDAGSDRAIFLKLHRGSTRSDRRPDTGYVDSGYHYANFGDVPARPERRLRFKSIYVNAASGADGNDGRTAATGVRTVARALEMARPGHRILLMPGQYAEGELTPAQSGTAGREILLAGRPGAVIDASGFSRAFRLVGRAHVILDGLSITGALQNGVEIRGGFSGGTVTEPAHDVLVRRCRIYGNGRRGMYVESATAVQVEATTIEDNGSRGVQVESGAVDVLRSSIRRNPDSGLWALLGSSVSLADTDVTDNADNGIVVWQSAASVTGGLVSGSRDGGIRFSKLSTGTLRDVLVRDNADTGVQVVSSTVDIAGGEITSSGRGVQAFVDATEPGRTTVSLAETRICDNGLAGIDATDTEVVLTDASVCGNGRDGVRQTAGSLQIAGGTVIGNQGKGITADATMAVTIEESVVSGNTDNGVQIVGADEPVVGGCVLSGNRGSGASILDSASPLVWNNLVVRNGADGVLVSGDLGGSPNARILNNTFYGNGDRGLVLGGSDAKPASDNGIVLRNIFQGNIGAGLHVNRLSLPGFIGDFNLSVDAYGPGTPVGSRDVLADPVFVDAAGSDFRLSQRAAGQNVTSPAVDAGGVDVAAAGLTGTTTRTDGQSDLGAVDLGYHSRP